MIDGKPANGAPWNIGTLKAAHKTHHIVCAARSLPIRFCYGFGIALLENDLGRFLGCVVAATHAS
jgi:hypothetical protein